MFYLLEYAVRWRWDSLRCAHVSFFVRVIYNQMGDKLFPEGKTPSRAVIWDQVKLAQLSTTVYAMLPVLGEFFIEEGYTRYVSAVCSGELNSRVRTFVQRCAIFWTLAACRTAAKEEIPNT